MVELAAYYGFDMEGGSLSGSDDELDYSQHSSRSSSTQTYTSDALLK
jgi:hypothetical protein